MLLADCIGCVFPLLLLAFYYVSSLASAELFEGCNALLLLPSFLRFTVITFCPFYTFAYCIFSTAALHFTFYFVCNFTDLLCVLRFIEYAYLC